MPHISIVLVHCIRECIMKQLKECLIIFIKYHFVCHISGFKTLYLFNRDMSSYD